MNQLTQQYLLEILDYNPDTGVFTNRFTRSNNSKVGQIVGTKCDSGYVRITIKEKTYLIHRLAWFYVHGYFPTKHLDHINGIKDDNRIANLREATGSENNQNMAMKRSNTSGFIGVNWCKKSKKWESRIRHDGKRTRLGYYDTPQEAYAAYLKAKLELHTFNPVPR